MNLIKKTNLFSSTILMLFLVSTMVFWSCEKDTFFSETEEITQSQEFEDYLVAHFQFMDEIQSSKTKTKKVKIGQVNGKNVYRYSRKNFDKELFNEAVDARNNLINKYPNYSSLNNSEKKRAYYNTIQNSKRLNQIVSIKPKLDIPFVRLKSAPAEADDAASDVEDQLPDQFSLETLDDYEDAYDAARAHGDSTGFESGGYIFDDSSAIFFVDDSATSSSMSMPVWNNGASTTYHYHPGGTPTMSSQDSLSMDFMDSYGIDTCIIVTSDSTYTYGF
jgi:proteasome lid subunit RPN8/RPN11